MFQCECGKGPFDTAIDLQLHQREFHSGNKATVAMDVSNTGAITQSHQPVTANHPTDATSEEVKPLRGKLPDGFPAKDKLEAEGHTTYAKVRAWLKSDVHITGIGDATRAQIEEAIAAKPESEDEE